MAPNLSRLFGMVTTGRTDGEVPHQTDRLRLVVLILFLGTVILVGWHSDDAYHGYTMARNLADGHGFVYNIGERVNASTCPLFTLVIAGIYFVTGNMFFSGIFAGVLFSGLAFYLLVYKNCTNQAGILVCTTLLMVSHSFMSYTTSGLENSLLYFLSALYLSVYYEKDIPASSRLFFLALLLALIAMTRLDTLLLFLFASGWVFFSQRKELSLFKAAGLSVLGLSPLIVWEAFSLFYYGFLIPNTAFVKLGTGIDRIEYLDRGLSYFLASYLFDLVALVIPTLFMISAVYTKEIKSCMVAVGILFYYSYLIFIGGDFMAGRYFALLVFLSVWGGARIVHGNHRVDTNRLIRQPFTILVLFSLAYNMAVSQLMCNQFLYFGQSTIMKSNHVADERAFYYPKTGLLFHLLTGLKSGGDRVRLLAWPGAIQIVEKAIAEGKKGELLQRMPGIIAFYYNDQIYLQDQWALSDALLSKLPAVKYPGYAVGNIWHSGWRIGHMDRQVPDGYQKTVQTGINSILNPSLHEYYNRLTLIIRGDLLDTQRWKAIVWMNLGKYNHYLEEYNAATKKYAPAPSNPG